MKKTDKIAYKQKSVEELQNNLSQLKKKLVELKAKHHTGNQKDSSVFKKIRDEIALVLTLLNNNDK